MNYTATEKVLLGVMIFVIVFSGTCSCAFRWHSTPAKADVLPPLYLDHFLPAISK